MSYIFDDEYTILNTPAEVVAKYSGKTDTVTFTITTSKAPVTTLKLMFKGDTRKLTRYTLKTEDVDDKRKLADGSTWEDVTT
jgi:hypothetical protein